MAIPDYLPRAQVWTFDQQGAGRGRPTSAPPLLIQKALLPFLRSKQGQLYPQKLAKALVKKRDLVLATLKRIAPPGLRWTFPSGGLNLWITLPEQLRAEDVLLVSRQQGIVFLPGSLCFPGEPEFHHLRLSFAQARDEDLVRAVIALCQIVSELLIRPRERHEVQPIL